MAAARRLTLLTGATGFVGTQILRALTDRGVAVRVVVRAGSQRQLPVTAAIETRVTTPDLWQESAAWYADLCRGVDTVIHAAWYAEPGQYLHSAKNRDCVAGTLRLARGASAAKVTRFVGLGTCFEYDLNAEFLSVATPLRPATAYAQAKAEVFQSLLEYFATQDMAFAWCRLFYLHGEGEDARRLVPYLRTRIGEGEPAELTSGRQIRDYLDVRDAAGMIVAAALSDEEGAINICSGTPVTIRELAERIADEYGRRDLLRFGVRADGPFDPPRVVGVPSAIRRS